MPNYTFNPETLAKAQETGQGCKITDLDLINSYCRNYGLFMPFLAALVAVAAIIIITSPRVPDRIKGIAGFIAVAFNGGLLIYYAYMLWFVP